MYQPFSYFPIFGPEIACPHCRQMIQALALTDTYLCQRHGAFEADPKVEELVHLQSSRRWRRWQENWYRQHIHADGLRFEIYEALDRLHGQGFRATYILIAQRYKDILSGSLERLSWGSDDQGRSIERLLPKERAIFWDPTTPIAGEPLLRYRLYGLPVEFSAPEPCWDVINFELRKEPSTPPRSENYRSP